jgi:hypothetical protein
MPLNPSTWAAGTFVTAYELNQDLYSYTPGNNLHPNGLLFHANNPLLWTSLVTTTATQGSSSGGVTQVLSPASWRSAVDTSALLTQSADVDVPPAGLFEANVNGSAGTQAGASLGGFYLAFCTTVFAATSIAGGAGAGIFVGGSSIYSYGGVQLASTTRQNAAYALDLLQDPSFIQPGGYCANASGGSSAFGTNADDYTGSVCTFGCSWSAPNVGNLAVPSSLPSPPATYTAASTIASSNLNGAALALPLQFLNNPPQLRVSASLTTSIANSASPAATAVAFSTLGANDLDNWSGYNGSGTWTAPVSGVYLIHASVGWAANATNNRLTGIQVNGTTTVWGPAYQAAGTGATRSQITRLLDLQAGDTIQAVVSQNSGAALALSGTTTAPTARMIIRFVSALAASSGSVAWTPPDTGYRWAAGTPGSQLPALFNTHLTNDLYFLIQRPYLMAYQTVAQTGLSNSAFSVITMDTLTGRIHGSAGDNYGGWVSGTTNRYVASVPGWYLIIGNYIQAVPSSTPAHPWAAAGYYTSGGSAQGSNAQLNGQHVRTNSATYLPGAEIVSMAYLRTGDYIQPQYQQQDGGSTYNTSVAVTGQESSFGMVWISE